MRPPVSLLTYPHMNARSPSFLLRTNRLAMRLHILENCTQCWSSFPQPLLYTLLERKHLPRSYTQKRRSSQPSPQFCTPYFPRQDRRSRYLQYARHGRLDLRRQLRRRSPLDLDPHSSKHHCKLQERHTNRIQQPDLRQRARRMREESSTPFQQ